MLHTAKVPTIVICLESIHHIRGVVTFCSYNDIAFKISRLEKY